jgi:hypothetical protein
MKVFETLIALAAVFAAVESRQIKKCFILCEGCPQEVYEKFRFYKTKLASAEVIGYELLAHLKVATDRLKEFPACETCASLLNEIECSPQGCTEYSNLYNECFNLESEYVKSTRTNFERMIQAETLINHQKQFESVASSFLSNFCDCNNNDNQKLMNEGQLYQQHDGLRRIVEKCQVCNEDDRKIILELVSKVPDFNPSDYSKYFTKDRFGIIDLAIEKFPKEEYAEIYQKLLTFLNKHKSAIDYSWSPNLTCTSCEGYLLSDIFTLENDAESMLNVMNVRELIVPCDFCPKDQQNRFLDLLRDFDPNNEDRNPISELYTEWLKTNYGCVFCLPELVLGFEENKR